MADGRGQGVYMLHRKTRSRSWKGVAVLGALPHFVRCVCQVPTSFQRSYATAYAHPAPLRCHFPCPPWAEAGLAREISAESDGAKGTKQEFVGRWAVTGVYVVSRPFKMRRYLANAPHAVRKCA